MFEALFIIAFIAGGILFLQRIAMKPRMTKKIKDDIRANTAEEAKTGDTGSGAPAPRKRRRATFGAARHRPGKTD